MSSLEPINIAIEMFFIGLIYAHEYFGVKELRKIYYYFTSYVTVLSNYGQGIGFVVLKIKHSYDFLHKNDESCGNVQTQTPIYNTNLQHYLTNGSTFFLISFHKRPKYKIIILCSQFRLDSYMRTFWFYGYHYNCGISNYNLNIRWS